MVNATGSQAGPMGSLVGVSIPIRPRRGQIAVTNAVAPLLHHCMITASYIAAKFDPSLAESAGQGLSMEQTENGNPQKTNCPAEPQCQWQSNYCP